MKKIHLLSLMKKKLPVFLNLVSLTPHVFFFQARHFICYSFQYGPNTPLLLSPTSRYSKEEFFNTNFSFLDHPPTRLSLVSLAQSQHPQGVKNICRNFTSLPTSRNLFLFVHPLTI
jgi:hypothetical protein